MKGCVYRTESDLCKKFTTDHSISFCVGRNCPDRKESNADRIRSMTDEELTEWVTYLHCPHYEDNDYPCDDCEKCWLEWLQAESGEA